MKLDELEAVLSTAERYTLRTTFDSSDVESAIVILENAMAVARNNAPIYFAAGNIAQWSLCMMNASQFGQAIHYLKARGGVSFDASIDEKAHEAQTSHKNDSPEPSQSQKEAGNYKKGRIVISGLKIAIENPCGSCRTGVSNDGIEWSNKQFAHYGYIERSDGADGDEIDVYVKEGTDDSWGGDVYVINQLHVDTAEFDEHKCMIGFGSEDEAVKNYLSNYDKDWQGLGSVDKMSFENFKRFVKG